MADFPELSVPAPKFALWQRGYRAFYLAAMLAGAGLIALWTIVYSTHLSPTNYYEPIGWHGHEMLFGFAAAVLAGYLLTISEGWSQSNANRRASLVPLVVVWLAGRLAPLMPEVPAVVVAAMDLLFLPLLAFVITPQRIVGVRFHYNFVFICLWLMTLANIFIHGQILGYLVRSAIYGQNLMIYFMMLMVVVMGKQLSPHEMRYSITEKRITALSVLTLTLFQVVFSTVPDPLIVAGVALTAAVVHAVRVVFWLSQKSNSPLEYGLCNAYIWIVLGFVLYALSAYSIVPKVLSLHAFTVGGLGTMSIVLIMNMVMRHHTDTRGLGWFTVAALVTMNLAAVCRVFLPILGEEYSGLILISATFWVFTFLSLLLRLFPALVFSRQEA